MKKSSEPAQVTEPDFTSSASEESRLQFPVNPEFVSRPPHLDPQLMLRRYARNVAWRNSSPGTRERRLAEKISAEFVL